MPEAVIVSQAIRDALGFDLPNRTASDGARIAALAAGLGGDTRPTSLVGYRSAGRLLIIGPAPYALQCVESLGPGLDIYVLATEAGANDTRTVGATTVTVRTGDAGPLRGYLGAFDVLLGDGATPAADLFALDPATFDLVLDLRREPAIRADLPPPGYFAPGRDGERLERVLAEIPGLVGEFEKPVYVAYDPDICAHGRRGVGGCNRCLETCPADAIRSLGERIEVDAHRCQGAGGCATACPTGALEYVYPDRGDLLSGLRRAIAAWRATGSPAPAIVFVARERGREILDDLPEHGIPWPLEEVGAAGAETWLSCIAYGAAAVIVRVDAGTPDPVRRRLGQEAATIDAVLAALGFAPGTVAVADDAAQAAPAADRQPQPPPATFAEAGGKRATLRLALDHLVQALAPGDQLVPLGRGAPFGAVQVDRDTCTLCMACVAVCPTGALSDGVDTPLLGFVEWDCVQCGLCEHACPENSISLQTRLLLDPGARRQRRILNEEAPFRCIACGKPFATASMIRRMEEKLSGHRMFQGDAVKRLKMCEDCRVRSMFDG